MRPALVLLVALACASAASAQAAEDRYGPAHAEPARLLASNTAVTAYRGRMLNWSGRVFTPQVPEPSAASAPPGPVTAAPVGASPVAAASSVPLAPPAPRAQAAVQPSILPDSLYSPPPPRAAPPQQLAQVAPQSAAAPGGSHVRLYSVHRQYGLAPDAIPPAGAQGSNYVLIGPREGAAPGDDRDRPSDNDDRPF